VTGGKLWQVASCDSVVGLESLPFINNVVFDSWWEWLDNYGTHSRPSTVLAEWILN